jgi:hypothetical protein
MNVSVEADSSELRIEEEEKFDRVSQEGLQGKPRCEE